MTKVEKIRCATAPLERNIRCIFMHQIFTWTAKSGTENFDKGDAGVGYGLL